MFKKNKEQVIVNRGILRQAKLFLKIRLIYRKDKDSASSTSSDSNEGNIYKYIYFRRFSESIEN